jgi:teichuronic acid biosynthesis glycosyltransferase TuaC
MQVPRLDVGPREAALPQRPAEDRPLKVLVVTNMWPHARRTYSGIFVKEQVDSLREARPAWTVDVLFIDGGRSRLNYARGIQRIRARAGRARYDLVHAHYGLTGAAALLAGTRPLVTTFHGSDAGFIRWQTWVSRRVATRADTVVVVSPRMRRALDCPAAQVVPCGVDLRLFRPQPRADARRDLAIDPSIPLLIFPGDPATPVKGFDLFDRTLRELRRRGLPVAWRPLKGVARAQVPTLLSAADALAMTSLAEGSPMTVKEALACDVPCVSVDVGDVAAIISTVPNCAIVPRDPVAVAESLQAILEHGGRPHGRQRIQELGLDLASVAARLAQVYEHVMGLDPTGRGESASTLLETER